MLESLAKNEFRKIKSLPNKPTFWLHKFFFKCIPHACGNLYDISFLRKGCPQKQRDSPWKTASAICFSCQRSCWIRSADGIPIESLDVQRISEGLLVNKTTKELQDLLDLWGIRRASVDKICAVPTTGFSDVLKETVCTSQEKLEKRNTMTRPKVKLNKRLRFFFSRFDSLASGQKIDSTTRSSRFRKKSRGSPQFLCEKGTNLRFATCKWYNKTGGQSQPVRTIAPPKTSGGSFGNWDAWMGCWCSRWCCWTIRETRT